MQRILTQGFDAKTKLSEVEAEAAGARRLDPTDPAADYALGLVQLKRLKNDSAAESFLAALMTDPSCHPARYALFRLRLMQKNRKGLLDELVDSARDIADPKITWRDEKRRSEAATSLGRVIGYLAHPTTTFLEPEVLEPVEVEIEQHLSENHISAYLDGFESFTRDCVALEDVVEEKAAEARERQKTQTNAVLDRLQSRSDEAQRAKDSLKVSKSELKSKFEGELKEVDQKLASLNEDKANLSAATRKLEQMIQQTRVDIAKLQTELELRGLRGRELRLQPPLVDLQEELGNYLDQRTELEAQAKELSQIVDEWEANRQEVLAREKHATEIVASKIESAEKWNQTIVRKSDKTKRKAEAASQKKTQAKSTLTVQQFFPLDIEAESARLLKEHGVQHATKRSANSRKMKPGLDKKQQYRNPS